MLAHHPAPFVLTRDICTTSLSNPTVQPPVLSCDYNKANDQTVMQHAEPTAHYLWTVDPPSCQGRMWESWQGQTWARRESDSEVLQPTVLQPPGYSALAPADLTACCHCLPPARHHHRKVSPSRICRHLAQQHSTPNRQCQSQPLHMNTVVDK